eukprot:TRINITY_DN357_c0_g1_i13.p1 TRINITY_DN357_c0_g1~~TRINITY_DN357_c0_g1_i13.p1  ORF type:complete len:280 (+),score=77.40 TRINITY_DN357_c0_g1_i13:306-1145(+)
MMLDTHTRNTLNGLFSKKNFSSKSFFDVIDALLEQEHKAADLQPSALLKEIENKPKLQDDESPEILFSWIKERFQLMHGDDIKDGDSNDLFLRNLFIKKLPKKLAHFVILTDGEHTSKGALRDAISHFKKLKEANAATLEKQDVPEIPQTMVKPAPSPMNQELVCFMENTTKDINSLKSAQKNQSSHIKGLRKATKQDDQNFTRNIKRKFNEPKPVNPKPETKPRNQSQDCQKCFKTDHQTDQCNYEELKCSRCSKKGHLEQHCLSDPANRELLDNLLQ